jgi:urease accessory protein
MRGTSELALESTAQGAALLTTVRLAWPHQRLDLLSAGLSAVHVVPCLPVAVAACIAVHGMKLEDALLLFVQSSVANLVNAGIKLIPLGQSDGQRAIAALEGGVAEVAQAALSATIDDLGSAALVVDIESARHETQYTRLFRS